MAKKRYYNEMYAGMDARRRREMEDYYMIKEDHSAIANLPQDVKYVEYPKYGEGYLPERLDDTARGIEDQVAADDRMMMKHLKPEKY